MVSLAEAACVDPADGAVLPAPGTGGAGAGRHVPPDRAVRSRALRGVPRRRATRTAVPCRTGIPRRRQTAGTTARAVVLTVSGRVRRVCLTFRARSGGCRNGGPAG
ncbi:hypothetical protein ACE1SV_72080 [Streptomyces sp. E-15]